MTEPYLAYRTMPEFDQVITNLQQQNRALAADRDRYAAMLAQARKENETLRAEKGKINDDIVLWGY